MWNISAGRLIALLGHPPGSKQARPRRVAVVVSTWTGHPACSLLALCESIVRHPAGADFELVLSSNGVKYSVPPELATRFSHVFVRENTGYNIGAWEYAWRHLPTYDHFLFLQDDCLVLKTGWLSDFIRRFESMPACGLVGENLLRSWNRPWSELSDPSSPAPLDGDPARRAARARFFREMLARWGIPEGPSARCITTVVQFTSRTILEKVNGYNLGRTYEEAAAAEFGFSRKVEAQGYRLVQLGRRRHSRIAHPQWPSDAFLARMKRSITKRLP
jgi:hypothetical protein